MTQATRRCAPMVYTKKQASTQSGILADARTMPKTWKSYEECKRRYLAEVGISDGMLYDRFVMSLVEVLGL